ncbi:hypothetical protein CMMCAS04_14510 [Clavibacter michiganensis subsp. michiganensis]|nr:hypothetical protein CMMCAS04_14510 [Clavibacter michiganensis subsp. michiganensis]
MAVFALTSSTTWTTGVGVAVGVGLADGVGLALAEIASAWRGAGADAATGTVAPMTMSTAAPTAATPLRERVVRIGIQLRRPVA